jgi:hypothetical protein
MVTSKHHEIDNVDTACYTWNLKNQSGSLVLYIFSFIIMSTEPIQVKEKTFPL